MSSFLVDDKTINKVVEYLSSGRNLEWIRRQVKKELDIDLETTQGKEALGLLMWKMNLRGTGERYSGNVEDFRTINYKYVCQPCYNQYSALKSLSCWLYQCCEGSVIESKEFKFFERLKGEIAYHIISELPEYANQKWG